MNMYKSIIFDMDGVIIDSEPLWKEAEKKVFATVGINLTNELCNQTKGLRLKDMVNYWYLKYPWDKKPESQVMSEVHEELKSLIQLKACEMKGLSTLLERLKATNFKIGLASSSPKAIIMQVVKTLQINNYFTSICSAEDEEFGKPHPAVYLRCASDLGVPPQATIAIEDSVTGVIAACAASMRCIAVPAAEEFADARFSIAYKKVAGLEELHQLDFIDN